MCTDLRTKILKTAGELFFKFGIRSVSIDDICAELHISKKTFYTIFKQKDELIVELLDAMRQKKEKDYHLVMAQDGNVMDMLMTNFKRLRGNSMDKHLAFVYDLEKFYPELWYERQKMMRDLDRTQPMHMLQKGIDQGMYRKDLDVEATAILFTHLVEQVFKDLTMMSVSQRVDYALDMLVRMVCSEEGMAYYLKLRV